MSMTRASGAMPTITALQMAAASLAVPKSVIKTMVGRATTCAGDLEHAAPSRASASSGTRNIRVREIIPSPSNHNELVVSRQTPQGVTLPDSEAHDWRTWDYAGHRKQPPSWMPQWEVLSPICPVAWKRKYT